jgi:hypothetical protein
MTITARQCAAGRLLADVDLSLLSEKSGVPLDELSAFEEGRTLPDTSQLAALRASLEALGIEFLPEQGANGAGLRLKFSNAQSKALSAWESEGGEPAEDNVL